MLFPKNKGEIIDEDTLIKRIHTVVEGILEEGDIDDTVKLHNLLCDGQVVIHEDANGEPVDKDGKSITGTEGNEAWTYVFTKSEDE